MFQEQISSNNKTVRTNKQIRLKRDSCFGRMYLIVVLKLDCPDFKERMSRILRLKVFYENFTECRGKLGSLGSRTKSFLDRFIPGLLRCASKMEGVQTFFQFCSSGLNGRVRKPKPKIFLISLRLCKNKNSGLIFH